MKKLKILLFLIVSIFSYQSVYAETLSNHSTMSHTKDEIIKKYKGVLLSPMALKIPAPTL